MVKHVPQADEKSAKMGWFFDPGFIQNVQRVAADIENPSMEAIDSVLFALREMGFIKVAGTCEHGFTVDDCVAGLCELKKENEELVTFIRNGVQLGYISVPDHPPLPRPDSIAGRGGGGCQCADVAGVGGGRQGDAGE